MKCLDGPRKGHDLSHHKESFTVLFPAIDEEGYMVEHRYERTADGFTYFGTKRSKCFDSSGKEVKPYPFYKVCWVGEDDPIPLPEM